MKEYICEEEGISVNVSETEDVCPNCSGKIIDVNCISVKDWKWILENQIGNIDGYSEMQDIDNYLKVVEEIKKLCVKQEIEE